MAALTIMFFRMLRVGQKRRRTQAEMKQARADAAKEKLEIQNKLQQFEELKQQHEDLQQEATSHRNSTAILNDLESKGKIKVSQRGEIIIPGVDEPINGEDPHDWILIGGMILTLNNYFTIK